MKKTVLYSFVHLIVFVILTALTQVGGIVWLLALGIKTLIARSGKKIKMVLIFPVFYLLTSLLLVPHIAPIFGRRALPVFQSHLKPASLFTVVCNRHYLNTRAVASMVAIGGQMDEGQKMVYMDACFPFWDGFPLLPHLSHNDGKKVDIAFVYVDNKGIPNNTVPNLTGYGMFLPPIKGETNTAKRCSSQNPLYGATGWFSHKWSSMEVDERKTAQLVNRFAISPSVRKIFLEPHLKNRWELKSSKIRFHGCRAVRHDDHLHVEFK